MADSLCGSQREGYHWLREGRERLPLVLRLTSVGWMCVGEGDVSGWVLIGGCRDFIPTQVVCIPIDLLYSPTFTYRGKNQT